MREELNQPGEGMPAEAVAPVAEQLLDDLLGLVNLGYSGDDVLAIVGSALVEFIGFVDGSAEDRLAVWHDFAAAVADAIRGNASPLN